MFFPFGLLIVAVGITIVVKSEWLLNNFGRIGFFEEKLATSGGSRLGYKLLGLAVVFIGLLVMTNLIGGFVLFITWPLRNAGMMR
jgi:hypothetical protein